MIVHNIGRGPRLEDALFAHPITGHYRYYGARDGFRALNRSAQKADVKIQRNLW